MEKKTLRDCMLVRIQKAKLYTMGFAMGFRRTNGTKLDGFVSSFRSHILHWPAKRHTVNYCLANKLIRRINVIDDWSIVVIFHLPFVLGPGSSIKVEMCIFRFFCHFADLFAVTLLVSNHWYQIDVICCLFWCCCVPFYSASMISF